MDEARSCLNAFDVTAARYDVTAACHDVTVTVEIKVLRNVLQLRFSCNHNKRDLY